MNWRYASCLLIRLVMVVLLFMAGARRDDFPHPEWVPRAILIMYLVGYCIILPFFVKIKTANKTIVQEYGGKRGTLLWSWMLVNVALVVLCVEYDKKGLYYGLACSMSITWVLGAYNEYMGSRKGGGQVHPVKSDEVEVTLYPPRSTVD